MRIKFIYGTSIDDHDTRTAVACNASWDRATKHAEKSETKVLELGT